jgi:hypothetical protein
MGLYGRVTKNMPELKFGMDIRIILKDNAIERELYWSFKKKYSQ